jgi:hypothetical protein
MVLQHRTAVDQQAADQRAFTVVNAAAGHKAQCGARVLRCLGQRVYADGFNCCGIHQK